VGSASAIASAGAIRRLAASAVDALVLGAVWAGVMWITLRWCELTFAQAAALPLVPTAAFLLLIGVGYLLLFTVAGGQTLGKMACGLQVVAAVPGDTAPLTLQHATTRALSTIPSALALGLGFLPMFLGDRRALHDRLSGTRVVSR
jgi:uncharacterized RDD family membrane protein YckC